MGRALRLQKGHLVRAAGGGDDLRAQCAGGLDRADPGGRSAGHDQHGLVGAKLANGRHGIKGGQILHPDGTGLGRCEPLGPRGQIGGGDDGKAALHPVAVGIRGKEGDRRHAVAGLEPGYARPYRIDDPRRFGPQPGRDLQGRVMGVRDIEQVGAVERKGLHGKAHLARAGVGGRDIGQRQNLGPAIAVDMQDKCHRFTLSEWLRRRGSPEQRFSHASHRFLARAPASEDRS